MVINEAKAFGMPIVGFNVSYSVPYQTGVITTEVANYTQMAEEIIKLLKDYNYRKKKGLEAKESMKLMSTNDTIYKWTKLFEVLINNDTEGYKRLQEYTFDKKYSTLKGYKAQINKHIRPGIGKYNLSQINPMILQRFFNHLSEPNEKGKVLSPKSIKNVYIILSGILEQAVENEMISKNPCKKVKLPKVYNKQITPLTDKQVKDFLEIISTDEIYGTILRVIVFTGLRLGEAMGLTWDCVDFEKGALNINKQLQRRPQKDGGSTLTSVKSGKPRILKPAPFVMQLLKIRYTEQIMQKQRSEDLWLAWSNEEEHKKALVFTNLQGGYLIPKRVYLHFKSAAVAIGAPDARVHDLRHTYAVLSLQNGDDIKTVQENLGHASAAFTLDVTAEIR